jgi:hypothetical protein
VPGVSWIHRSWLVEEFLENIHTECHTVSISFSVNSQVSCQLYPLLRKPSIRDFFLSVFFFLLDDNHPLRIGYSMQEPSLIDSYSHIFSLKKTSAYPYIFHGL